LGITPVFYDAFLNDWWQFDAFLKGTLSDEKRRNVLDNLFIDGTRMRNAPKRKRCYQWDILAIDELGEVPVCCGIPNNHPSYSLGAVDDGITARLRNRPNLPVCKTCMETGMAYGWSHPTLKGAQRKWLLKNRKWMLKIAMNRIRGIPAL
jgi:hypothetical protein